MRRIVNYRPMCFFMPAQCVGILLGLWCKDSEARLFLFAIALVLCGFLYFSKRSRHIYLAIAFILGFVCFCGSYDIYCARMVDSSNAKLQGTVCSEIVTDENQIVFEITDVHMDGKKLKGRARVYGVNICDVSVGDNVYINGKIKTQSFDIADGRFVSSYHNKIYYDVSAREVEIEGKGALGVATRFRLSFYEKLNRSVDDTTGDIIKALVFGDKFGIDGELYDDIKASGLAHLLAVSGLHVGIVGGALLFLFSKFGIKGWYRFGGITVILLLYGWLCGFPASVIRAIILCCSFLLADCVGRKYDALSTLGLAGIADLLIFPTDLFSVGFLMSFASVLGIILLSKSFSKRQKSKLNFVYDIFSVSMTVNIMLFPIMASFFGQFQTLFLISNILLLPIIPFIYIMSLSVMLVVQIIPFLSPILGILSVITLPIKLVSFTVGSFAISSISAPALGAFTVLYYFTIILFFKFVFLSKKPNIFHLPPS